MEVVDGVEDDSLEQIEPSFSGFQGTLSHPFEALLKSSTDDELGKELTSVLIIHRDTLKRLSLEDLQSVFNIGLPNSKSQYPFGYGTHLREWHDFEDSIVEDDDDGVISIGPFVTTNTEGSDLEELKMWNGFGPSFPLSYRLYNTVVWIMRIVSNFDEENNSGVELKEMNPVMFAALTGKPNIVHFLVKYRIRFFDETHDSTVNGDVTPVEIICTRALLSDIITELFEDSEIWDSDTLELKTDLSNLPEGLRSKCLNFRLLLRCDSNPYVTTVKLASLTGPQFRPLPEMNVLRRVYDSLFPDWGLGFSSPPKLQHMCKCVIRRRLHEKGQLPDGISQLELSKILSDYLNLYDD